MQKAELGGKALHFQADGKNSQLLLPPAPIKVSEESSGRFKDSLAHHTGQSEKSSLCNSLETKKTKSVTPTRMLNELSYLNHVWTTCRPIRVSNVGSFMWWMRLSRVRICRHSEHSSLDQKPNRYSTTWTTQQILTTWCAVQANSVIGEYYLNNETVRRVHDYQLLDTYVRLEAQPIHQDLSSKQIELFLTLQAKSVLCSMKCSRIHG